MNIVMVYLCLLVALYLIHLILKLNWIATAILTVVIGVFMIFVIKRYRMEKLQEKRFYQACRYMDTILYAFSKETKVETALLDTYETVETGELKTLLKKALDHVQMTFDETEVMRDSLAIIEAEYPCKRIKTIHSFMLHVEFYGGEIDRQIALLLEDKKRWQQRVEKTIADRKKSMREVVMSVIASLIICGMILYLPMMNIDISKHLLTQIISVSLVIADAFILYGAQRFLISDWLNLDAFTDGAEQKKQLQEFRTYDKTKGRIISFVLGGIAAILSVLLFMFANRWLGCVGLVMTLVLINQHNIGHRIKGKNIKKALKCAFPNWLLDMVLLLQSENVQVAIAKSKEQAPEILLEDLKSLEARLLTNPEASEPYHEFMSEFEIPEIGSAMSMLYSLSMGQGHSSQIESLIDSNYRLLDEAEQNRLKDKSSGMYLLFLAPVLTASVKLVIDMAMFMVSFMGTTF